MCQGLTGSGGLVRGRAGVGKVSKLISCYCCLSLRFLCNGAWEGSVFGLCDKKSRWADWKKPKQKHDAAPGAGDMVARRILSLNECGVRDWRVISGF